MYVIRNGTVYTMKDDKAISADILVSDKGKIEKIAKNITVKDAKVIDATGKVVLPGFVDAHSHIGGVFMEGVDLDDLNECTDPLTPQLDSYYGITPDDKQFKIAQRCGITTSCLIPGSANVIGGWGIVLKSDEGTIDERLLKHPVCLKAATGINPKGVYSKMSRMPMTRMGIAFLMRDYFRKVKEYKDKKDKAKNDPKKMPPYDLGLEHGIPVLEKKIPLKVHTYMHDMVTVVQIAKEFDINVTIDHAQGASDYYDVLKDEHVKGVIFGPISAGLFPGEGGKIDFECCKGLDDRGITVTVMTDGPVTPENLLLTEVGEAVRKGMDPIRALRMITANAARILMVDDRVGSLEKGKDADILIFDALPSLDVRANLLMTMINGKVVYQKDEV